LINSKSHNWKSAQLVNSHLVCDLTIRQRGSDLPWQQWSLLYRFHTEQGHCDNCRRKWGLTYCVISARPRQCHTLSNPVLWQSWMVDYHGYTLQMTMLFLADQLLFMTCIRDEEDWDYKEYILLCDDRVSVDSFRGRRYRSHVCHGSITTNGHGHLWKAT